MATIKEFPNERMQWMDDLLLELEKFSERYELIDLREQLQTTRRILEVEILRVNASPDHPIHKIRGLRDN